MTTVNVHEAQTNFSSLLARVKESNERIVEKVKHHDLTVLPLTLDVCIAAADLPAHHDDPCDRFIISTAKLNDWTVVTADE